MHNFLFFGWNQSALRIGEYDYSTPVAKGTNSTPLHDAAIIHESLVTVTHDILNRGCVQRQTWVDTVHQGGESLDYANVNDKICFTTYDIQDEINY